MMLNNLAMRLIDGLTGYVVALRISAAAAMPDSFQVDELQSPAPIIRTDPAQKMVGDFDPRELLPASGDRVHVLVVEQHIPGPVDDRSRSTINLN